MENLRELVTGGQLPSFENRKICILGHVQEVASNGLSFQLLAVDNVLVKVTLRRPLDQPLSGYVQVIGTSYGHSVVADDFFKFDNEKMDVKSHNTLCSFLNSVPNIFSTM